MTGQTISHYRIIEKIGEGGMGVVYKAEDTKLRRTVALKFLAPHAIGTDRQKQRFIHEAQAAAALDHPNICTVYEIDEDDGHTFIAMALIEGQSLEEAVAAGPLKLTDTTDIASQVAEGLAAAHEKGVVHRDIKPGNVMITPRGRAKIMDFGLAKFVEHTRLTRTGMTTGTVAYMSPEQACGQEVDHRTDIWALGVMLYEMVTGRQPFEGSADQAVVYSILSEEPVPMTALRSRVPMDLERIAAKAMAKRPEERYQTMADMLVDLRAVGRFVESGDASAHSSLRPVGTRTQLRAKRRRMLFGVAAAAAVAVLSWLGWTQLRTPSSRLDPDLVVVAVFENRTGDELLNSVGQMTADCVTQGLSQTGLVDVAPAARARARSQAAAPSDGTPRELAEFRALAEETGAGTVVSGAYYLGDGNIRFQTSVTDVSRGKLIYALPMIEGPETSPMAVIDDVCGRVAGVLATDFDPVLDSSPPTLEAYREYVAGLDLWHVDWAGAADHFHKASELDSSYMWPQVLRAVCLFCLGRHAEADSIVSALDRRRQEFTPSERLRLDAMAATLHGRIEESLRHLRRLDALFETSESGKHIDRLFVKRFIAKDAILLNRPREALDALEGCSKVCEEWERRGQPSGTLPEMFAFRYECAARHLLGDYGQELSAARDARSIYPDEPHVRVCEIRALVGLDRVEEALRVFDACVGAPLAARFTSDFFVEVSGELRAHGHREASLAVASRGVEVYRSRPPDEASTAAHRSDLAALLYAAERWDEARLLFEELSAEHPDNDFYSGWYKAFLGCLAAREGRREDAVRISEELAELTDPYRHDLYTYWRAGIAAVLGNYEEAMRLLQAATAEGSWMFYDAHVHWNMNLESLQDYPPFQEFMRPKG